MYFGSMSPRVDVAHKTASTNQGKIKPFETSEYVAIATFQHEAKRKLALGETPRRLSRNRCRYSSLEIFEDAFEALTRHYFKANTYALQSKWLNEQSAANKL